MSAAATWGWEALRLCSQCEVLKHPTEFYRQTGGRDPSKAGSQGLKRECRECSLRRAREHRLANIEAARERDKLLDARRRKERRCWKYQPENQEREREARRRRYRERREGMGSAERMAFDIQNRLRAARWRAPATEYWTAEYAGIVYRDSCAYCGGTGGHLDHVVPLSEGGLHEWSNLTSACGRCNQSKNNKGMLLWLARRG